MMPPYKRPCWGDLMSPFWILKRLVLVFLNACRLLSALPFTVSQFGWGRLSLVAISFYTLSLLFGPYRLSEFTLAGPHTWVWKWDRPLRTLGTMCPTLWKECVGSLTSHRFITCARACETGPTVYRPYPRRLESLTVCRCYYKGSTFSSVIKRLRVLVWPGFEPTASHLADPPLSHWANQAAVEVIKK